MAFNSQEFADSILKDAQVSDAVKTALLTAVKDPVLTKKFQDIHEGNLRQSEFSKLMGEYQDKIKKVNEYWSTLDTWRKKEEENLASERAALAVKDDGNGGRNDDLDKEYLNRKDFETELLKVQDGAVGFLATLNDRSFDYFQRFGKKLDTFALLEKATKEGTDIKIAYDRYIQPEIDAQQKVEFDKRLKEEREAGRKEALANITIPVATQTFADNPHPLDGLNQVNKEQFGWKAAAKAHTEAIRTGKHTTGE